jgi:hypothetical protein
MRLAPCAALALILATSSWGFAGDSKNTFSLPGLGPDEPSAVGKLYGIPDLCEANRQNTDFFSMPETHDGIWWMDDKRLVGHEIYCEVKGKAKSEIKFLCHYEGDETERQTSQIKTGDGWIEIDGQRLEECTKPSPDDETTCETGRLPSAETATAAEVEAACSATRGEKPMPPKRWLDAACDVMLESYRNSGFVFSKLDGTYMTKCKIADWPINRENAIMACGDGTAPSMIIRPQGVLEFGRHTFYPAGSLHVHCG